MTASQLEQKERQNILDQQLAEEREIGEIKDWKVRFQKQFERHSIEILLLIFFAFCGLNYVIGQYSNNQLA